MVPRRYSNAGHPAQGFFCLDISTIRLEPIIIVETAGKIADPSQAVFLTGYD